MVCMATEGGVFKCEYISAQRPEINLVMFHTHNLVLIRVGHIHRVPAILDTGADINFLPIRLFCTLVDEEYMEVPCKEAIILKGVCGDETTVTNYVSTLVGIDGQKLNK